MGTQPKRRGNVVGRKKALDAKAAKEVAAVVAGSGDEDFYVRDVESKVASCRSSVAPPWSTCTARSVSKPVIFELDQDSEPTATSLWQPPPKDTVNVDANTDDIDANNNDYINQFNHKPDANDNSVLDPLDPALLQPVKCKPKPHIAPDLAPAEPTVKRGCGCPPKNPKPLKAKAAKKPTHNESAYEEDWKSLDGNKTYMEVSNDAYLRVGATRQRDINVLNGEAKHHFHISDSEDGNTGAF